ncbi:MAG TPA: hypothetical protein VGG39_34235 [Polyangiaceae bacterium]|jgi:hypothetical protein
MPQPDGVLARLPLQIGTTATWSAGRSAATLFPGLAIVVAAAAIYATTHFLAVALAVLLLGGLLVVFALGHLVGAVRNRASDVMLLAGGLRIDGGRLHGSSMPWGELTPPFAEVEETSVRRITMKVILLVALSMLLERLMVRSAREPVRVWRLHVHHRGQRLTVGETDRPIERDSMLAAAASVCAVVSGQRHVAQAPAVAARIVSCGRCGGPAIPDDAPWVPCVYCGAQVALPDDVRGQAAAAKIQSPERSRTGEIIARLRGQPRAGRANAWLLVLSVLMFGAWPLGWGLIAYRVLDDGFQLEDVLCLALPFAAVLAGFFLARGRLADRGALQLLTLGFGALAPARDGEPSRCRRCQGPLPAAGIGGVTRCRYCAAENIVGIDLRPSVDQARAEQSGFDDALRARRREKRLWTALSALATVTLLGWAAGTAAYLSTMVELDLGELEAPAAHAPPAATTAPAVARPPPRPAPVRAPAPTRRPPPRRP